MTSSIDRPGSVLDLLSDLHHLLESPRPLEDLLTQIASLLVAGYGARSAVIHTVDPSGSARIAANVGERGWPSSLPEPPDAELPAQLDDPTGGPWFLAVPGRAGTALRAVVGVWVDAPPEGDRRRVLDLVAEHAALAITDAEERARTDTTVRQLSVLHAYAGELQTAHAPRAVADALLRAVHEGLGFPRAILFLRDGNRMAAFGSAGIAFEDVRHLAVPLDEPGLIHDVVSTREPIVVSNPKGDPRMRAGYAAVPENPNALVVVPLVAPGGEVVGVLAVDDAGLEGAVSQPLLDALVTFSEQAVLALRNAELVIETGRSAATLEAVLGATDAGFILISPAPDGRLLFANDRVDDLLGIPLSAQLGRPADELVETIGKIRFAEPEAFAKRFRQGMADPEATVRDRFEMADGAILERYATPARDRDGALLGRVTIYRDVTRRERLIEELTGVARISTVFAEGGELPDLMSKAQAFIAQILRVSRVSVSRRDRARQEWVLYRPTHGFTPEWEETSTRTRYDPRDPVASIILGGRPFRLDAKTADAGLIPLRELFIGLGIPSLISVPLLVEGEVIGILSVFDDDIRREFTDREVRMLTVLGGQLAPFLRSAELVRDRLELAAALTRVERAAARIVAGETVAEIAWRTARAGVEELGLDRSRVWILEDGRLHAAGAAGHLPWAHLEAAVPTSSVERVLVTRKRFVTHDLAGEGDRQLLAEGLVAFAGFPLILGDRFLGVLTGYSRHPLRGEVVDLLGSISRYASAAIGKTRALERERLIARTLQEGLIPRALDPLPGLSVAARYFSATSGAEVGGDLYDAFRLDERCVLFVADVSGKGIAAASTAGLVRHSLRALATRETEGPRIMQYLNRTVVDQGSGQFVTALLGTYEPDTRRLLVTAAGHPPPILRRADGRVEEVDARGPALGLFADSEYEAQPVQLEPGDAILLYTDGIAECRAEGDMYGVERLLVSAGRRAGTAAELVELIVSEASEYCGGSFGDDVAVIAVMVEPGEALGTAEG